MATQHGSANPSETFQVLRPKSPEFQIFFPDIYKEHMTGQLSEAAAEDRGYHRFRGWVSSIANTGNAYHAVARSEDFQHNVLVRFEENKLAERYIPSLGKGPMAYVRGIAKLMVKEHHRKRALPQTLNDSYDAADLRALDPSYPASVSEVGGVAMQMVQGLPPVQQEAILKKYGPSTVHTPDGSTAARESVRRFRGIAQLRAWLGESGITEF